ncbi:MAG: hypothetical protein EBR40_11480 [Proteobacteria bacterium]|nr:hypothetical protein [Pseudomonadota bacterium]
MIDAALAIGAKAASTRRGGMERRPAMAGEWIAVDLALDEKPEVQELIDLTGQPVEAVCYRLWKLWGWASMHCADGTARMTIPRLARTCGGDDAFWRAVAAVGWLEIDETAATVAVPGWDRRFSQAAKARLQHQDRAKAQEERDPDRRKRPGTACAQAQAPPAPPRSRGEERTGEVPPPPREASQTDEAAWATLLAAWNTGAGADARRRPWKPAQPPPEAVQRLAEPGWIDEALEAIPLQDVGRTASVLRQAGFCQEGARRQLRRRERAEGWARSAGRPATAAGLDR